MSRENVELVERLWAAMNSGDLEAVLASCHPDVELDWSRAIGPEPGVYHGHDGLRRFAQSYQDVFDEIVLDAEEFIDAGDEVAVPHVGKFRHHDGLTVHGAPAVFVFTIKNGQLVRFRMFNRRDEALAAVGLPQ
jgi:ketosteroid isomerase-like protein